MLETEQDKMMREGYPEETKRRYVNAIADANAANAESLTFHSLAEKNLCKRVQESARQYWLEMGVLSVTFTAYTAPNGLMVVDA